MAAGKTETRTFLMVHYQPALICQLYSSVLPTTGADVFVAIVGIHREIQYSGRQTGNTYIKI